MSPRKLKSSSRKLEMSPLVRSTWKSIRNWMANGSKSYRAREKMNITSTVESIRKRPKKEKSEWTTKFVTPMEPTSAHFLRVTISITSRYPRKPKKAKTRKDKNSKSNFGDLISKRKLRKRFLRGLFSICPKGFRLTPSSSSPLPRWNRPKR